MSATTTERDGHRLILLRHGQSAYNAANVFTGWDDPPLTRLGAQESARAGDLILAAGLRPTAVHTSLLARAISTARLAQAAAGCADVQPRRSWRLNGRHYGALQGHDKDLIRREYGAQLVERWRRSYRARPPELRNDPNLTNPKYAHVPLELLPHAESLRDVLARVLPYWFESIVPDLRDGGTVLVVAHGNTLRALIKRLDRIPEDAVSRLEVRCARPILYRLDDGMRPLIPGGSLLDGTFSGRGAGHRAVAAPAVRQHAEIKED